MDLQVWADADMINGFLVNLLENAIKVTPTDGHISLGCKQDGEWMQLWIQDSGPGIPPDAQEDIFKKFTRLRIKFFPKGV